MQRGVTNGVIMAPGAAFMKDPSKSCNAIRASFSKASYEEMDLVINIFLILLIYFYFNKYKAFLFTVNKFIY